MGGRDISLNSILNLFNFEPLEYITYWEEKEKLESKETSAIIFLHMQTPPTNNIYLVLAFILQAFLRTLLRMEVTFIHIKRVRKNLEDTTAT